MHEELADLANKIIVILNKATPGVNMPQVPEHDIAAVVQFSSLPLMKI